MGDPVGAGARRLVVVGSLVVVAAVGLWGGAAAAGKPRGLAALLLGRDPGARVAGDTIVGTDPGSHLLGVRDRPNFIIALGAGETVRAGGMNDELGARGSGDTIVAGGSHALVVGGPGSKLVANGKGHDLLIDRHNDGVVLVNSPGDEVVLSGQRDRVVCGRGVRVTIYKGKGDSVSKSCRAHGNRVLPISRPGGAGGALRAGAHAAQSAVTGNGSNDSPFIQMVCESRNDTDCVVAFPARRLPPGELGPFQSALWANEYIPAYKCPPAYPYLRNQAYEPAGTNVPLGVEVPRAFEVGVSFGGLGSTTTVDNADYFTGTRTGFPNSSATNWAISPRSYQVKLHCTNSIARAAKLPRNRIL